MKTRKLWKRNLDRRPYRFNKCNLQICILGVYGKGNLGDEAILRSIREEISSVYPGTKFTVFCSNPKIVSNEHDVVAVSRKPLVRFFKKLHLVRSADLLLLGGGTLLRDDIGWEEELSVAAATLFWPVVAKLNGVLTMTYGQGVGPARHHIIRCSIRHIFSKIDAIALRDALSTTWVTSLTGKKSAVITTCDPVVTSPSFAPDHVLAKLKSSTKAWIDSMRPYTVVALRMPERGGVETRRPYYERYAKALVTLHHEFHSRLILVPVQISESYTDDRAVLPLLKQVLIREGVSPDVISYGDWDCMEHAAALLQCAELVVSDRLHALLIAARAGVAVVSTSSKDKIRGCLEMIGRNAACNFIEEPDPAAETTEQILFTAWQTRKENRSRIIKGLECWRKRTPSNLHIMSELLSLS